MAQALIATIFVAVILIAAFWLEIHNARLSDAKQVVANQETVRVAAEKAKQIVCQHCQTKGFVSVEKLRQKQGISGGKATAAVLTGGLSVVATGLSRHEQVTKANCSNCGTQWFF